MNSEFYMFFLAGGLGVILQVLLKIRQFQVRSKVANHIFTIKQYLKDDWATIIASFISVMILIVCLDELLAVTPQLVKYIKWLFVFVGFTGSSIIQAVLSVTNKKLMAIIDVKSNIADGIEPIVDKDNELGAEEIIKENNLQS